MFGKTEPLCSRLSTMNGGEQGIRTLGTLSTHTRFPVVLLKPLGQLSAGTAIVYTFDVAVSSNFLPAHPPFVPCGNRAWGRRKKSFQRGAPPARAGTAFGGDGKIFFKRGAPPARAGTALGGDGKIFFKKGAPPTRGGNHDISWVPRSEGGSVERRPKKLSG